MRETIIGLSLLAIGGCLYGIGYINGRRKGFSNGVRRIIRDRNKPIFSILVGLIEAEASISEIRKELDK